MLQELEFTGVMRFYYQAQDLGSGQKVCVDLSWIWTWLNLCLWFRLNFQAPIAEWFVAGYCGNFSHRFRKLIKALKWPPSTSESNVHESPPNFGIGNKQQNVMKCVVFFYFEPLFFAQNNDQEIFVAHLIVFSGRNQMYTSLKHGHKQGSHWNSHWEIPARHEDVGGNKVHNESCSNIHWIRF